MDEPLEIRRPPARIDRRAVERELHDVVGLDAVGRARARQQVALRIVGMAHADVAEGIHHALARENAVSGHEFFDEVVELGHWRFLFGVLLRKRGHAKAAIACPNRAPVSRSILPPARGLRAALRPALLNFSESPVKHFVAIRHIRPIKVRSVTSWQKIRFRCARPPISLPAASRASRSATRSLPSTISTAPSTLPRRAALMQPPISPTVSSRAT